MLKYISIKVNVNECEDLLRTRINNDKRKKKESE